jgi:phage-related protein
MARGTDFGGVHSHFDLRLIQQKVEVQPAEPKLNLIEIPGADGFKDYSETPAGRVVFKPRKISWTFALYPGEDWDNKHSQVAGQLNGRSCKITLDSDPDYYYDGRLAVAKYNRDRTLRQIVVEATCQPFKLKQLETSTTVDLSTSYKAMRLWNSRKPVIPTITVTAATTLLWKGGTYAINAGTHRVLGIQLQEGENELQAKVSSGTGRITVTYREGAL